MKTSLFYICLGFTLLTLYSCKPAPTIKGFDSEQWKNDPNGCKNERAKLFPVLEKNRNKLIKVEAAQVLKFLGRPDKNELSRRNQRFHIYFVEPGGQCKGRKDNYGKILRIRFDALNRVSEVIVN